MEDKMNEDFPLTIYFDASCPLCNSEVKNIELHDVHEQLVLVDCSAQSFSDTPFYAEGITRQHMMQALHVRNNQGVWFIGVAAFELIYRTVGLTAIANFWAGKITGRVAVKMYPWIAKNRQLLSRTGLQLLFRLWAKCVARRTNKRSRQCREGQCSI